MEDLLEDEVGEKYNLSDLMKNRLIEAYERDKPESKHQLMYDWYNRLWKKDGIAKTLRTNEGCSTAGTLLFPQMRRLTPKECALLQGFPKDFIIPVSDTQAYKQFGNTVTIPVIEKIGLWSNLLLKLRRGNMRNRKTINTFEFLIIIFCVILSGVHS